MSRVMFVLILSFAVAGPAMACGMSMHRGIVLGGAFDAIDGPSAEEVAQQKRAQERSERLAVNWIDEVGEVPLGSLPRIARRDRPVEAAPVVAEAAAAAEPPVTEVHAAVATPSRSERVLAALAAWLDPGPARASARDTADTATPLDPGV